jgi:hypothetical protein
MRRQITKDSEWIVWLLEFYNTLNTNKTEWAIPAQALQQFATLVSNARRDYKANANPVAKNHKTAFAKDESFRHVREYLTSFLPLIISNDKIGNQDLEGMGLHTRDVVHHNPLARPAEYIELEVIPGKLHQLDVYASIPRLGQATHHLKAHQGYTLMLRYKREDEYEWHELHSSRLHVNLAFDAEHAGKNVTISGAWINPTFQRGPWSDEVTVLIN